MKLVWVMPLILVSCGPAVPTVPPEPVKKFLTGKVTFSELSERELAEIRVIPEFGRETFTPGNRFYAEVDGFWWKENPNQWFKIPDHGEAWIGKAPVEFDGEAPMGGADHFFPEPRFAGVCQLAQGRRGGAGLGAGCGIDQESRFISLEASMIGRSDPVLAADGPAGELE